MNFRKAAYPVLGIHLFRATLSPWIPDGRFI